MSTRFSADSSTNIWEHLNGLDDDLIAHDGRLDALEVPVDATEFSLAGVAGTGWFRIVGPFVEVHVETSGTIVADGTFDVYTLPPEARPPVIVPMMASTVGAAYVRDAVGRINTAGVVVVRNLYTSAAQVVAHAVYLKPAP